MDHDNTVRPQSPCRELLNDIDAVEINRCVRMIGPGLDEYVEVWPEGEALSDEDTMQGEPFYTVFLHYRPGGDKHGIKALCDCPSRAHAELIAALLETALEACLPPVTAPSLSQTSNAATPQKRKDTHMTSLQLINLAFSGYPGERGTGGDSLALFIARELADTFEPGRTEAIQLSIAAHALQRGVEDLQAALKPICQKLAAETARKTAAAKLMLKAA